VPDEGDRLSRPSVVLELHTADRLVRTLVTEAFAREGLDPSLFAILSLIAIHEPVTPTRLGAESGVRPTTLRDMVNERVERELESELGAPVDTLREPLRALRQAAGALWLRDVEPQLTRIRGS
jgi:hypothetical protein